LTLALKMLLKSSVSFSGSVENLLWPKKEGMG
jgi:hypothetical protein